MHTTGTKSSKRLYQAGLVGALAMSIVMLMVTFTGIAPNLSTQIAMGVMALIVGFFGVQGLLSEIQPLGLIICILFSVVEVFSHTSLGLVSTHVQSQEVQKAATQSADPEYTRLVTRANELNATAKALAEKVATMGEGYSGEVKNRTDGIKEANARAEAASNAVTEYVKSRKAEPNQKPVFEHEVMIDSSNFFTAIPDALTSGEPGRIIAFWMYVLLFSAIVLTSLMTAAGLVAIGKKEALEKEDLELKVKAEEEAEHTKAVEASKPRIGRAPGVARNIPKKVVYAWVDAMWHGVRMGTSDKILNRATVMRFLVEKGIPITKLWEEKLYRLALELGVINEDGTIGRSAVEARKMIDDAQKRGKE